MAIVKKGPKKVVSNILWYIIIVLASILFILPFIWMVSTAFKTAPQCVDYPPTFIPDPFTLRAFQEAFTIAPFFTYIKNSLIVVVLNIGGMLLSCTFVAYGFSRFRSPHKNLWFGILLSTMMLPSFVLIIPQYSLYVGLRWVNTFLPLVVPAFLATNAFSVFMLRQFFLAFPKELDESAQLDGCSYFGVLYRILLPNSKTVLFVVALFAFVGCWNDFFAPMIYLGDMEKYTLAVGLVMFKASQGATLDMGPMMAAALVSIIPTLVLYLVAQKYFVQGVVTTGLKG
ncbi:MAG: carbohydrate ABC transporter permease [Massiliimalia sp.]|jgi:multiple sugar transport system permease protein